MTPLLEARALEIAYGEVVACRDISVHVAEGEIVTLIGANGAGKSSTLRAIAGALLPRSGAIRFCGEPGEREKPRVLEQERLRSSDVPAPEREPARVHDQDEGSARGGSKARPNAADHPAGEHRFRTSERKQQCLRQTAIDAGQVGHDPGLLGTAGEELAPEPVVEPHTGHCRRRKPSAELPRR